MFAVIESPCSPKQYNALPSILAADTEIKRVRAALDQLVERGSETCRATPFVRGEIGAFLLHKHWEIRGGECMIERVGAHPTGKPALITSAQRVLQGPAVAPSRFKVDPERRQLLALEFSSDEFVVQVWRMLVTHPTLLMDVCRLIADSGLADQVGLAIFARASVWVPEGEELVEENWDRRSVLSAQALVEDDQSTYVPTGWPFVPMHDITAATCIAYCMLFAGAHCRHHYRRPDQLRVAPAPRCMLHD